MLKLKGSLVLMYHVYHDKSASVCLASLVGGGVELLRHECNTMYVHAADRGSTPRADNLDTSYHPLMVKCKAIGDSC